MRVNPLFKNNEDISIELFLDKLGIDCNKYLSFNTIEESKYYINIEKAKSMLAQYINQNNPIYLLVDCDTDGYCSSSIMYLFLKEVNNKIDITPIFHDKNPKSHGLVDNEVMEYLKGQEPSLLIIPDAGTNDVKGCQELSNLGYEIIILDHHNIEEDNPYAIVVNNQVGGMNKMGSGGLVTWHFCNYLNPKKCKNLISYVMVSLIGDSMNMQSYENATFTKWGKRRIHKNLRPFIKELNSGFEINKDYAFGIIPKINATIRFGEKEDKENLFYALVGEFNYQDIIVKMKSLHSKQNNKKNEMADKILSSLDNQKGYVLYEAKESNPINGLSANVILDKTKKPTFIVTRKGDLMFGSVRSNMSGLRDELNNTGLFVYNSGHGGVFGTCFHVDKKEEIENYLSSRMCDLEPVREVFGSYRINNTPKEIFALQDEYKEILGNGLDIKVHIDKFNVNGLNIKELGANKLTIKFTKNGIDFIMFFVSKEKKEDLFVGQDVDYKLEIIGTPQINEFMGNKKPQIVIEEYEVSD